MNSKREANYLERVPVCVLYRAPGVAHVYCFVGDNGPAAVRGAMTKLAAALSAAGGDLSAPAVVAAFQAQPILDYYGPRKNFGKLFGFDLLARQTRRRIGGAAVAADDADGAADAEIADINRMLADDSATSDASHNQSRARHVFDTPANGRFTLILDYAVYPEDSFANIKSKIFAAVGIPTYRQHLALMPFDEVGEPADPVVPYVISTTGIHKVNIFDVVGRYSSELPDDTSNFFGIIVDADLYSARADLRVDAKENVKIARDMISADAGAGANQYFVVADLAWWVDKNIVQLRATIKDLYQLENIYNGFVVKYFPQLRRSCYIAYIDDESKLGDKFPDLAPTRSSVRAACEAADSIAEDVYCGAGEIKELDYLVTRAAITSIAPGDVVRPVNLRDLFDSIACTRKIADVIATVETTKGERAKYEFRKFFKAAALVSADEGLARMHIAPSGEQVLVVLWRGAVKTGDNRAPAPIDVLLYVKPNGRYSFQYSWGEEDLMTYDEMSRIARKTSEQIIAELTAGGAAVAFLRPITSKNMTVNSLTATLRWHKTIMPAEFAKLRGAWDQYIRAGFIISRNSTKDAFSFTFTRGITEIDTVALDRILMTARLVETNSYAYLSDSTVRQKWQQNVAGRLVTVSHQSAHVGFTASGIYETEFATFSRYIESFIRNFRGQLRANRDDESRWVYDASRGSIRRLQELDPELYNLKKHGSKKVFAVKCQKPHQPHLYAENEKVPATATKYWNFTTNKPAYYSCPNAKFPHLNFIVNAHPLGYCLPCCSKLKPAAGSTHAHVEQICLRDHKFSNGGLTASRVKGSSFVMAYGHDLPPGRLSHLPPGYLRDALNRAAAAMASGAECLILGVDRGLGAINAICALVDVKPTELMKRVAAAIESDAVNFDTLAGGQAATYFSTKRELVGFLASIRDDNYQLPQLTQAFMRHIVTECANVVFGLKIVYLNIRDNGEQTERGLTNANLIIPREGIFTGDTVALAVLSPNGNVDPVLVVNPDDFVRSEARMTLTKGILSRTLPPMAVSLISKILREENANVARDVDLSFVKEFARETGRKITKLYVGMRGLCYAVRVGGAYVPILYSPLTQALGVESYRDLIALDCLDEPATPWSETAPVIDAINKKISGAAVRYNRIEIKTIIALDASAVIGAITNAGICYFSSTREDMSAAGYARFTFTSIDPRLQNRALSNGRSSVGQEITKVLDDARVALYKYYEYDLFCSQFLVMRGSLRNDVTRARLAELVPITSRNNLPARLGLPSLSRNDYGVIVGLKSPADIPGAKFDMDSQALIDLYSGGGTREELKAWLIEKMAPFVTAAPDATPTMPILIEPCDGTNAAAPHCVGGRQLVIVSKLETLCAILAADLRNPLKRSYIFSRTAPESRTAFTDFTFRPSEVIIVTKKEK